MSPAPSRGSGRAPRTAAPPAACAGARTAPRRSAAASRAEDGRAARRRRGTAARRCRPTRALPRPTAPAAAPRPAPSARRCGGAATAAHLRPDESAARADTAARQAPERSQPVLSGAVQLPGSCHSSACPRVVVADGDRREISADRGVRAPAHRDANRLVAVERSSKMSRRPGSCAGGRGSACRRWWFARL